MEWNREVEVRDGGYVRGGVGGWLTFTNCGVDGSSFFIPNLFTPNPVPQYSWFHQTIPNVPSSVLLLLCTIRNSLLNHLTFPNWISTAHLTLLILHLSTCFFFILNLSAISSGSRSRMSYRHVSCWMIWTNHSSSKVLGRVKKWLASKKSWPSRLSTIWGMRHFLECVFIVGGVMTISAIGIKSNPGGWSVCH